MYLRFQHRTWAILLLVLLQTPAAMYANDRGLMSLNDLSSLARSRSAAPGVASYQYQAQVPVDRRSGWQAEPLTEREIDVLQLLRGSLLLREIAVELRLSPNTVKSHTRAIYRKLGVSTRHAAIARGQDADILPPGVGPRRGRSRAPGSWLSALHGMTAERAGSVTPHGWDGAGAPGEASQDQSPARGTPDAAPRSGAA